MFSLKESKQLRILDFDIENRPLTYGGMDFTFADITAIAAGWVGQRKVHAWFVRYDEDGSSQREMLTGFLDLYNQADIVTGHYVRGHDLPHINAGLMEHRLGVLGKKLVSDTKVDLMKRKGISASQESLSDMLGVRATKYHMTQDKWRSANRLRPIGIAEARRRVVGDIRQHKLMRLEMLADGILRPPSIWTP